MTVRVEKNASLWKLAMLLFVSGNCALLFQLVWIRELRLIFGSSTSASAAVLAIFMGGLGLGNLLFGRFIDNTKQPLRMYGLLEVGIAISAAISPFIVDLVRMFYVAAGGKYSMGATTATAFQLIGSIGVLLIPTMLMGGTLPTTARSVSVRTDKKRQSVALLYGLNTIGAVTGAWLGNFVLLEFFGNRTLLWSACIVNVLLAVFALKYSNSLLMSEAEDSIDTMDENVQLVGVVHDQVQAGSHIVLADNHSLLLVCTAAATVGAVFFLMEIVWYRMLGPLLGGTTYTFGLILCTALLGIGIGGAIYSAVGKWFTPSLNLLAASCTVEAMLLAIPFWSGDSLAMWVLHQQTLPVDAFADQVWNWFQVAVVVILPASIVSGFQFPVLIAIAGEGRHNVGKHVGLTFASNTAGAIAGSLSGGFFLLPILTAPGVWRLSVAGLAGLGVLMFIASQRWQRTTGCVSLLSTIVAVCCLFSAGPTAVWRHSGIGANRADLDGQGWNYEQDFKHKSRRRVLWEAEGVESSVAITATDSLSFIVNGKADGNAISDAGTQIGLGLLGPLLHSAPTNGLVIGLGTGESAGWMANVDSITNVDVVELEPSVLHMAELCSTVNGNVLENPKVDIHFNDAREFLLTVDKTYDLIVSEPSNPYRAGIANLYTQEFYESTDALLTESGLFLQWLQGYEVDVRTVKIVMTTLRRVFPKIQIWQTKSRDMIFVCGKSTAFSGVQFDALQKNLLKPTIQSGLQHGWRVTDVEGVLAHYVCGQTTINDVIQDQQHEVNTDDKNLLEYAFAKSVGKSTRFSINDLRNRAIALNDEIPFDVTDEQLDTIVQRRLALHLYLGGIVPPDESLSSNQRIRVMAYNAYLKNSFVEADALFSQIDIDQSCIIESTAYAHTLAFVGKPIPEALLSMIQNRNPDEAEIIATYAQYRLDPNSVASKTLIETVSILHSNPWLMPHLLDTLFHLTIFRSASDPEFAKEIYQEIGEPFAMYRFEEKRLLTRFIIAENIGVDATLAVLASLEPNIPWKESILKERAKVYKATNHPLASQAAQDIKQFHLND